jgi:hypothetical protein
MPVGRNRTVGSRLNTNRSFSFGNLIDSGDPVNLAPDGFSSVGGEALYDFRIKATGKL